MVLEPDEDAALRVITELAPYGELPPLMSERLAELLARDRRAEVREPEVVARWVPNQRRDSDD